MSGAPGIILMLSLLPLAGCATTLVPPADLTDPVNVYLLDHGGTSSLVLPAGPGRVVRYAYGDWDWYAMNRTDAWNGVAAMLWPTRAALGRVELEVPRHDLASVRSAVMVPAELAWALRVERDRVTSLRAELDALHARQAAHGTHYASDVGLTFVVHPRRYHVLHNSNHAVAGWLRELGVHVRGTAIRSIWHVRAAPEPAP